MSYKFKIVTIEWNPNKEYHNLYKRTSLPFWVHLGDKWEFVKQFETKKEAEDHIQLIKTYPREKETSFYYASGHEDCSYCW